MGPGAGSLQSIMVPDPVGSKTYGSSEFFDMNCQKTLVFSSMLFIVYSTGGFLQKTILVSSFKTPYKKIRETRKL